MKLRLADIAHARSGDKGDRADIGLFAWDEAGWRLIDRHLDASTVAAHFAHLLGSADPARVSRYPLPNLLAFKWVLHGALDGGAARSLRSDNLGKTIAAQLLRLQIDVPDDEGDAALAAARRAIERF